MNDDKMSEVKSFKTPKRVSPTKKSRLSGRYILHRIKCRCMKWRKASSVLCDKRIPIGLKGKLYKTVVKPAMMFVSKGCVTVRKIKQDMSVTEMKMLKWMIGGTREDRIRNKFIRGSIEVAN